VIAGLVLMVAGALDPLEGSVMILGGNALSALGAFLSRSRYRLPVMALAMTTVGVGALHGLSAIGGVGGNSGRSGWWLLLCVPYDPRLDSGARWRHADAPRAAALSSL
jgi:hypothetical protein